MKVLLIGKKNVEYTSGKTGKEVKGVEFTYITKDPYIEGYASDSLFVNSTSYEAIFGNNLPKIDDFVEIEYNNKGWVVSVTKTSEKPAYGITKLVV